VGKLRGVYAIVEILVTAFQWLENLLKQLLSPCVVIISHFSAAEQAPVNGISVICACFFSYLPLPLDGRQEIKRLVCLRVKARIFGACWVSIDQRSKAKFEQHNA
jgi:hypothetical protein